MMDAKFNSTVKNEKMDDEHGNQSKLQDSLITASESSIVPDNTTADQTGSLAEVSSLEQISTEDTELSSHDFPENTFPNKTIGVPTESNLHNKPKGKETRAVSICGPCSVKKDQPQPLCALLPPSMEACTVYEVSQSFTSISRSQERLKTTTVRSEPTHGDDLCASILLACLFCHPLDCLLATVRGCNACVWSLCSSLCGCESNALQPLLDVTHHCDFCRCLGVRCCLCDCPICDICLQATECLDLAMEISQMLYH
ncbi:myoD family inhibitor domain-containing protein isoform X1 [Thunnus maccoyii]|uniref:myoD family inhibitor domain-containing protein isoform X1 n=2 Tax=Thunnus maccoyii TaxID=8240 RepID=UPI001C4B4E94|nr:myoD family inhibitor domain-containing protein isoform X1 [Thunnus maccoyii]XP_042262124.1 myoD family inhibitor domain-containing protein isoform X1 [Thunnus maccoyii]XP_042262126.1 myoD family inhibitor domain-containing protein isoform X1 [Thunnus maccoyii]XP_042262127.1 myoD family inhibitor domain-containing protein isoform X1 [Thunnus maccoyii]